MVPYICLPKKISFAHGCQRPTDCDIENSNCSIRHPKMHPIDIISHEEYLNIYWWSWRHNAAQSSHKKKKFASKSIVPHVVTMTHFADPLGFSAIPLLLPPRAWKLQQSLVTSKYSGSAEIFYSSRKLRFFPCDKLLAGCISTTLRSRNTLQCVTTLTGINPHLSGLMSPDPPSRLWISMVDLP